ncbi:MAG TPA: P22 phage major capsid protein family protein [Bryobacteraceae bacterium]|nr:P22 phage major capsid protein family protein [Bryobacteraceae bacterium]
MSDFVTPQVVAREALSILMNNLVLGNLIYTDASQDFVQGVGDTVSIRRPSAIAAREFTGTPVTQDLVRETKVDVKLDKHMYVQVPVTGVELTTSIQRFSEQVIQPAIIGHAQAIDAAIAGLYRDIYTSTPVSGTPSVADIAAVGRALSVNKVPFTERRLVLDPVVHAKYVTLDAFLHAEKRGGVEAIRDAEVGRVLGLDAYIDQNIVTHVRGTVTSGNATGTAGASTVALASLSGATHTLLRGDIFTIAGDTQPYVVTENRTASGSAIASCPISPALKTSPSGAAIAVVDTAGLNALAFHKTAFALAVRPLAPPLGQKSEVVSYNGLSLRVVYGWDNTLLSDAVTIDCLWGVKTLDPERAVRLID